MKQTAFIILAGLIALTLGITTKQYLLSTTNKQLTLPEFIFPDISGKQRSIFEWKGKILVINFWATWCPPCREEIPELISMQQNYSNKGLQVIGIAIEDKEAIAEFAEYAKINYPILIAGDQGIVQARILGNTVGAVPYTVIADKNGQIVYRKPGQMTQKKLLEVLQPLW